MSISLAAEIPIKFIVPKKDIPHLERSILSTMVYYNCLDYPLTTVEIFRYLVILETPDHKPQTIRLSDIIDAIDTSDVLKKTIKEKNGFYFLRGRESIVEKRIWRKKLADEKWKKIKPLLKICLGLPYVRAIFVSGSLALGNTKKESDIDVMVVAKKGRIWTCRAILAIFLSALGKYRQARSTTDKVCTNHYITDQTLTIPYPSLYNAQTYAHFFAVDAESNVYLERFKKANHWIEKYVNLYDEKEITNSRTYQTRADRFWSQNKPSRQSPLYYFRKFSEYLLDNRVGDLLENKFKKWETEKIQKSELYGKAGGRITISDDQLEFHPDSPEKTIVERYNRKMKELGFKKLANLKDSGLK